LRPDGYPDYLAALNQQACKGVTPENNAVVLLVQAFGPQAIDRKYRDEFFKMLGVVQPPEEEEHFVDYDEFVQKHAPDALKERHDARGWHSPSSYKEFRRAVGRPWSEEECPLVAGWLGENQKPLARIVEASRRSRFYFPLLMCGDWLGTVEFWPSRLPLRSAVRCLMCRAMLRLREGKTEQAWNDLQACHRLTRLRGWASVSTWDCLVAMTCDGIACYADRELAHFTKLTREQAQRFCADMENLSSVPAQDGRLDRFERFLYLDSICATARRRLRPSDIIPVSYKPDNLIRGGDTPEWKTICDSLTNWIGSGQVDWNEALHLGNEYFDHIGALTRMPLLSERRVAGGRLAAEIERQKAIYKFPRTKSTADLGENDRQNDAPRSVFTRGVFVVYTAQLVDTVGTYAHSRTMIASQLVPVSLALSAYRTEHGQYPDKLGSLQPKYLARLPKDPWGTGDYQYRRQDDGYLLYSIGPDGKDSGGPRAYPGGHPVRQDSDDLGAQVVSHTDADDE
jgi:hypothetical protein